MYAQQLVNGTWRELAGNIEFSSTVYQSAESLSDEQRIKFKVYFIVDADRPELTNTQKYGDPIFTIIGANVERSYPVVNKTPDEINRDNLTKANEVRADRNSRLSATDWRFRSDMTPSQAWIDYCQALRDVPNQPGFPWQVQWPVAPK